MIKDLEPKRLSLLSSGFDDYIKCQSQVSLEDGGRGKESFVGAWQGKPEHKMM